MSGRGEIAFPKGNGNDGDPKNGLFVF